MLFIIDAYNLIGKINIISLADKNKEEKLVTFIQKRGLKPKDKFLLVFDGKDAFNQYGMKEKKGPFTMYYTSNLDTADDYIITNIKAKKEKSNVIVVSSDREIIRAAKRERVNFWKAEEFLKKYRYQERNEEIKETTLDDQEVDFWLEQFGD